MNARQLMVLTGCISAGLWFGGVAIAAEKAPPATTQWDNRQADGTYLLVT
ncbi:MAG: hypothetical protein GWO39_07040, partial [Gammaproteobacteria bacterium]|nr:hypothetical protein [Gammaproteobacteria bacterium]NIT63544.1 hypothetical protein [Gammaproteobacteria bacterium]NIV19888.1 hypothetical protein [Gammaproteobacteria bacterium]NIY32124.1 hypothetical protein [Gammaproteobacteria bacterium]